VTIREVPGGRKSGGRRTDRQSPRDGTR
jgi:hypothetical protein